MKKNFLTSYIRHYVINARLMTDELMERICEEHGIDWSSDPHYIQYREAMLYVKCLRAIVKAGEFQTTGQALVIAARKEAYM